MSAQTIEMATHPSVMVNISEYGPCPARSHLSSNDNWMVFVVNGAIVLISVLGLVGNLISGVVLSMPQMRSSYGLLLTFLTVSDSIQLLSYILLFGPKALKYYGTTFTLSSSIGPNFSKVVSMSLYVVYTASAYITIILSCERYTAVCKPFRALRIFPTKRRSFYYAIGVITFAILFNLPKWWETSICRGHVRRNVSMTRDSSGDSNPTGNAMGNLTLSTLGEFEVIYNDLYHANKVYRIGYLFMANFLVNFLIPLGTLMVLNVRIYNGIRETSRTRQLLTPGQQNENSITVMLIVVVGVFCACHIWFTVKFILRETCGSQCVPRVYVDIANLLLAFNASINFAIYCLCGKKFRQQLQLLFTSITTKIDCSPKGSVVESRHVLTDVETVPV